MASHTSHISIPGSGVTVTVESNPNGKYLVFFKFSSHFFQTTEFDFCLHFFRYIILTGVYRIYCSTVSRSGISNCFDLYIVSFSNIYWLLIHMHNMCTCTCMDELFFRLVLILSSDDGCTNIRPSTTSSVATREPHTVTSMPSHHFRLVESSMRDMHNTMSKILDDFQRYSGSCSSRGAHRIVHNT